MTVSYEKLFNSATNRGLQQGMEVGSKIDPVLHGPLKQMRQAMIDTFEINKLTGQTEYVAVCLTQLANVNVGSETRKLIRVKARIPELHSFIPIPKGKNDWMTMAFYPTFIGKSDDLQATTIEPGTHIRVTFENHLNFAGPTITKILSLEGVDTSTTLTNSSYATGRRNTGAPEAPDPAEGYSEDDLKKKSNFMSPMPTRIHSVLHTTKGVSRKWLFADKPHPGVQAPDGIVPWVDGWQYGAGGLRVTAQEGRANINALAAVYDVLAYYWSQYSGPEPPISNLNLRASDITKLQSAPGFSTGTYHAIEHKNRVNAGAFKAYERTLGHFFTAGLVGHGGPVEAKFERSFKAHIYASTGVDPNHSKPSSKSRHKAGQATDYNIDINGKRLGMLQVYMGFLKLIDAGVLPPGGLGAYFCSGKNCGPITNPTKIINTGTCHYDYGSGAGRPAKWLWWNGVGKGIEYLSFVDTTDTKICDISRSGAITLPGGFKAIYDNYDGGKDAWLTFGAGKTQINGGLGWKLISASGLLAPPADVPGSGHGSKGKADKHQILIPEVNRTVLTGNTFKRIYQSPYNIEGLNS
tara:strand:- start:32933 stop:34669 length:1737 start_codon:yes stop_codon:yes gene_type:complete